MVPLIFEICCLQVCPQQEVYRDAVGGWRSFADGPVNLWHLLLPGWPAAGSGLAAGRGGGRGVSFVDGSINF